MLSRIPMKPTFLLTWTMENLGFVRDTDVKYEDIFSGDNPTKIVSLLYGGPSARINSPMITFQNFRGSYPVIGVLDLSPGLCYRTSPKSWMGVRVLCQCLNELHYIYVLPNSNCRVLHVWNFYFHRNGNDLSEFFQKLGSNFWRVPPNATHLIQQANMSIFIHINQGSYYGTSREHNESKREIGGMLQI